MPEQIIQENVATTAITKTDTEVVDTSSDDDFDETMLLIEYCYAVHCSFCNAKVIDPDKTKNQVHLKGRCPTCNLDPDEEKFKRKMEKREQKQKHKRGKRGR